MDKNFESHHLVWLKKAGIRVKSLNLFSERRAPQIFLRVLVKKTKYQAVLST